MKLTPESSDVVVVHNPAEQRFEARVAGELAVCEYRRDGDCMVLTHTFVPEALRGRSVAQSLVRVALEYARTHHRSVVPACSYVAAYIERHHEYRSLLHKG